jgi:hypothetical protein
MYNAGTFVIITENNTQRLGIIDYISFDTDQILKDSPDGTLVFCRETLLSATTANYSKQKGFSQPIYPIQPNHAFVRESDITILDKDNISQARLYDRSVITLIAQPLTSMNKSYLIKAIWEVYGNENRRHIGTLIQFTNNKFSLKLYCNGNEVWTKLDEADVEFVPIP